ncbi:MAG: Flp pilus assembly complex ATPase component [bacterium]|nr:Flp pilus assembly complex ATPase component [bacterium]
MAGEERYAKALLKVGVITEEQLAEALRTQQEEKKSLGRIVLDKGWCSEKELTQALARTLRLRTVNLKKALISRKVLQLVPRSLAIPHHILPLLVQNSTLFIAIENPLNRDVMTKLKEATQMNVTPLLAILSDLHDAVRRHYNISEYVGNMLEQVEDEDEVEVETSAAPPTATQSSAPSQGSDDKRSQIVRLWNMIVSEGMKARASDVHIEPSEQNVRVRYRVDGMLSRGIKLPGEVYKPLLSRIKMLSGMDMTEHRNPQDGHVRISFHQRKVDLRVSTVPASEGEQVVIRILDQDARFYNITRLGLSTDQLKLYHSFIEQPQGLILVTGSTGTGKTTTLYALLNDMKDGAKHIVTIEDPIECQLEGITQIQINPKSGINFASGLRSVLRQDPNVILLGEIRDAETASVALQAAETGHLVLSTLHTVDAVSAVSRLLTLGISHELLASNLLVVIAQCLVRKICPRCIQEYTPDFQELQNLGLHGSQAEFIFYRGEGCKACKNTGYYGRTGVHEIFVPDERLREDIASGTTRHKLKRLALESGMQTILENGVEKVLQGLTTVEEILRVCPIDQMVSKKVSEPVEPESVQARNASKNSAAAQNGSAADTSNSESCHQCEATLQAEWLMCPFCGTLKTDLTKVPSSSVPSDESSPKQVDVPKLKERIVVAEDDQDARMMIKFFLQQQGYQVILAVDGEEALEKIRAERPDIVILDINMPKKDGFAVCKALRSKVDTMFTPVIMLTAQASVEYKLQGLSLGADDYLTKPFHPSELGARIENILRRSYQREVLK